MTLQRFKTNPRLWLVFSLTLFLVPWFIPMLGKYSKTPPLWYPVSIFGSGDTIWALKGTGTLVLLFGVPAVLVGWVLQCIVTMFRRRKENPASAAQPAASPNGGPAAPSGGSGGAGGPPSVP